MHVGSRILLEQLETRTLLSAAPINDSQSLSRLPAAHSVARHAAPIAINLNSTHQTIYGFGAGLKRQANTLLNMPEPQRDEILKLIFQDVHSRILRTFLLDTIESPDGSFNFNTDPGQGAVSDLWSQDQIQAIQAAQQWSAGEIDTFYASCNTAPAWMKTNNSQYGGTVSPAHYADFAKFISGYASGMYRHFGIRTGAISLFNEPDFSTSHTWMDPTPRQIADMIGAVGKTLQNEYVTELPGISRPLLLGSDGETLGASTRFMKTIDSHPADRKYLDVASSHAYGSDRPRDWTAFARAAGEKPVWETEVNSGSSGTANNGIGDALTTVDRMYTALVSGNAQAFVQFQWVDASSDPSTSTGLINITGPDSFVVPMRYYAFKQFVNTTTPGSMRVGVSGAPAGLKVVAFESADRNAVTLQVINDTGKDYGSVRFALPARFDAGSVRHYVTDNANQDDQLPAIDAAAGSFSAAIGASSFHTFVIHASSPA
jgi:O-glycosyl hydrolase